MLLGIILFPLSMGFSLICRMWAFSITHNQPLGRADWSFILGWCQRPECFNEGASSLGLASGPASPFLGFEKWARRPTRQTQRRGDLIEALRPLTPAQNEGPVRTTQRPVMGNRESPHSANQTKSHR